jgi:hypothetical protein
MNPSRPGLQRQADSLLYRVHIAVLLVAAVYAISTHVLAAGPIIVLLAEALIAIHLSPKLARHHVQEILFLLVGALTCLWCFFLDETAPIVQRLLGAGALAGWIRFYMVHWILVPIRPGMLKNLNLIIVLELLLLPASYSSPSAAQIVVLVVAMPMVLALSALLEPGAKPVTEGARLSLYQWRPRWRGPLLWTCIAAATVLLIAPWIPDLRHIGRAQQHSGLRRQAGTAPMIRPSMQVDPSDRTAPTTLVAHLRTQKKIEANFVYLRALALPILTCPTSETLPTWSVPAGNPVPLRDEPVLHQDPVGPEAVLLRQPGTGDMVLMPDGCGKIFTSEIHVDSAGNLYRTDLHDMRSRMFLDMGAERRLAAPWDRLSDQGLEAVPASIAPQIREAFNQIVAWKEMDPAAAAQDITRFLAKHCRYADKDLPSGWTGQGNFLLFLLGKEDERRGHCQYFASAGTILLRLSGHRARVVVGFISDEIQHDEGSTENMGSSVVFRALHAHAWSEVLIGSRWQRCDFTPPTAIAGRSKEFQNEDKDPGQESNFRNLSHDDRQKKSWHFSTWIGCCLGVVMLSGVALILWRRRRPRSSDQQRRALEKYSETLIDIALSCGITITPKSTIAHIAGALSTKTGIDLTPHLASYHAARYGQSPELPIPWPATELRRAAKERGGQE